LLSTAGLSDVRINVLAGLFEREGFDLNKADVRIFECEIDPCRVEHLAATEDDDGRARRSLGADDEVVEERFESLFCRLRSSFVDRVDDQAMRASAQSFENGPNCCDRIGGGEDSGKRVVADGFVLREVEDW
jgi:hypothetical protein